MNGPQLVCVAPDQVHRIWPHVEPLLRSAVVRTGISPFGDIEGDILAGRSLVWLAWSGEKIEAAASTALQQTDAGKVCVITACGGTDMRRWLPLLEQIEGYAAAEGCTVTRIFGREGWLRALDGYQTIGAIMDKACRPRAGTDAGNSGGTAGRREFRDQYARAREGT